MTCDTGTDLGVFSQLGLWTSPGQLSFDLSIRKSISGAFILWEQPFCVTLSRETMLSPNPDMTTYYDFSAPQFDAQADRQVLLDTPQYTVTLLGLGGAGEKRFTDTLRGVLLVENHTQEPLILELQGAAVNGVYINANTQGYFDTVPPLSKSYQFFELDDYAMEPWALTSVEEITLLLQKTEHSPLFSGNSLSELHWCAVKLSRSGKADPFPEGERVLFEEEGVRVCLIRSERPYEASCQWYLSIVNDSDQDIALGVTDIQIDGESRDEGIYLYDANLGAGQKTVCRLGYTDYSGGRMTQSICFRLRIMDFKKEAILYTGHQEILLNIPAYEQ